MILRFDVSMVKNHALKKTFIQQLRNRFQALTVEVNGDGAEDDIQGDGGNAIYKHWKNVVNLYTKCSKKTIGCKKKRRKEWITPGTWTVIEERRTLKKK